MIRKSKKKRSKVPLSLLRKVDLAYYFMYVIIVFLNSNSSTIIGITFLLVCVNIYIICIHIISFLVNMRKKNSLHVVKEQNKLLVRFCFKVLALLLVLLLSSSHFLSRVICLLSTLLVGSLSGDWPAIQDW